jgi:hypothetical protein
MDIGRGWGAVWCVVKPPNNAVSRPGLLLRRCASLKQSIHATGFVVIPASGADHIKLVPQMARFWNSSPVSGYATVSAIEVVPE